MKRFLFVLKVKSSEGAHVAKMFRSYEAATVEEAREKLAKECSAHNRKFEIVREFVEI